MAGVFPPSVIIDQNTDWRLNVKWEDPAGNPVNLTGYTARFALAQYNNAETLVVTQANGITLDAQGNVNIHLNEQQTSMDEGTYEAELDVISSGGETTCLLKGNIAVRAQV